MSERLCRSFAKAKGAFVKSWTKVEIDAIQREFQKLKLAYQNEGPLKDALDNCDYKTSFQTGWNYVQNQFNSSKLFVEVWQQPFLEL